MQQHSNHTARSIGMHILLVFVASLATTAAGAATAVQQPAATLPLSASPVISGIPKNRSLPPRIATSHILVELESATTEAVFLDEARGLGLGRTKRLHGTNWYTVQIASPGASPRDMADSARRLPGVLRAAADPILRINDQIPPRDPYYVDDPDPGDDCDIIEDTNCDPESLLDQWGLFKVGAEGAWNGSPGSPETVIAIIDSGVDFDHDDLWANIWTNPGEIAGNGIDDDDNGFVDDTHGWDFSGNNVGAPDDDPASEDNNPDITAGGEWIYDPLAIPFGYRFNGDPAVGDGIDNNLEYYPLFFTMDIGVFHGTTVAGIVAAMTDNILVETGLYEGFAGTCWHCSLMPLRIINAEGDAFGSDAAEAIYYAVDNGARIINASWGIPAGGATQAELAVLEQAIQYAASHGVIVVAAAGNSGTEGLYFPASMPETIAVGSSNWLDVRSDFSSYASPADQEILDVVAPGEAIWNAGVLSAYDAWILNDWLLFPEFDWEPWHPGDDVYIGGDGTSFAAPLVSGYLGLILSRNPCATPAQARDILRSSATDIESTGYDVFSGYGRINMVVPDLGCSTSNNQLPIAGFTFLANALEVSFSDQSSDPDGSISTWHWDFGDGSSSNAQNPTHTYAAGSYAVTLTVTDDGGASASRTQGISVDTGGTSNEPPVAAFTYSCNGKTCSYDAGNSTDDTGIVSYAWDFGDGNSSTGEVTQHDYTSQGTYRVTLAVTDEDNLTSSVGTSLRVKNRGSTSGSAGSDGGSSGTTTLEAEKGRRKCTDGIDNDGDGFIDANDTDCR
ncbi:MAG: S8 family serine peptidase [Gammaproteobacteria bacterium]|nr:S8 family serine peptidase [Gammaproteobacteria bacterium]